MIHNLKYFEVTHSAIIRELKGKYGNLSLMTSKQVNTKSFKIKKHKEFIYDTIILICASCKYILKVLEDHKVVDFYDKGGKLMFLGDS